MAFNPRLASGAMVVGGPVADNGVASGNPVPVGGDYQTTSPTYVAGDRATLQTTNRGVLLAAISDGNGGGASWAGIAGQGDGGTSVNAVYANSRGFLFNGTGSTWDRTRTVINATDSIGTGIAAAGILGQVDEVSPTTITENQFGNVRMSPGRALYTEEMGRLFLNLASQATTTIKTGAGFFHALIINTPAATGVITIYDNTAGSGTKIATITQPAALLDGAETIIYNVAFATGLTVVTATATQDLTFVYR